MTLAEQKSAFEKMEKERLSKRDQLLLERILKIKKKVREITAPMIQDMIDNRLEEGESSVERINNSIVMKQNKRTYQEFDLKMD
jgi:hypothetical protein